MGSKNQMAKTSECLDNRDSSLVAEIRARLDAGTEQVVPAAVVERLDEGQNPTLVFRQWRSMTQEELASETHVRQSFVSMIEMGQRQPAPATLARIAQVLKIDPGLLLPWD